MWLPQFPGSNIGKPACCRTAACMMGKDEILPYVLQFLSSTTHIPGNCAEGGETAPARIPRHIPTSRLRLDCPRLPVEPQPLGADSALSESREQHHGQLPRSLGSVRLSAPETVERRRKDRWLRQTQLHRKRQGEKPPAWLGSGGGCGGGARGEIIQELCRFRLKKLPVAGVHVERLSCWGLGREGGAGRCTWMPRASAGLLSAPLCSSGDARFQKHTIHPLPTFQT